MWSLTRLINLKGNPSFLLAGETITANGPETVVMTSAQPNPGLPYILPNPATGTLEQKVVAAQGGTDAADTATKDTAEDWLNANSAGSGPYILKSFSTTSQVVLVANPNYWGPQPAYSTVVLRNTATAAVEKLDVQRGVNEIAIDLDPSQTTGMSNVQIKMGPSPNVMFLFANDNPKISKITPNHDFQMALRYGIDYAGSCSWPAPEPSSRRGSSRPPSSAPSRPGMTPSRPGPGAGLVEEVGARPPVAEAHLPDRHHRQRPEL